MIHPPKYTEHGNLVVENVWHALCNTREEAVEMIIRSKLLMSVKDEIKSRKLSTRQVCKVLGIEPEQAKLIKGGGISAFSMLDLLTFCVRLGFDVSVNVTKPE